MNIQLLIVVLYIAVLFVISWYAKRLASQGSTHFLLAGRALSPALVAVSIAGLAIGGASTIGVSENAYNMGLSAGWYDVAWAAGAFIMGLLAAGKYRELQVTTIPELFERFYDKKGRIISVIGQIIIMLVITSLQYVAGGAILASLLPQYFNMQTGMITSALVFIGMTLIGGMWSAGLSNLLNVSLIYIGTIIGTFMCVKSQGGLQQIALAIPDSAKYFSPIKGAGMGTIMAWMAVMITQTLSAQGPVQIACGAKDARAARNGFLLGGLLILPIGFLSALMGIAARAAFPGIQATLALPKIIMSLDPVVAGITLAALWAADVSTAGTLLLGSATLFSQDIWKRFIQKNMDDKQYLLVNRLAVALLGILTYWMAASVVGIVKTLVIGLSLTTAFTVIFLFTVFAPGLCRKNSAFYTTLVGIIVLVLWQFVPAIRILPHVIYLEWIVCLITFLVIPLFDSKPARISIVNNLSNVNRKP
jgi:SSS family solute:Na+ symporter